MSWERPCFSSRHAQVTGWADGTVHVALSMFSDALFLGVPHSTTLSSEDRVGSTKTCASHLCRLLHLTRYP